MFVSEKPQAYEKVYAGLVERLAAADLASAARGLGLATAGDSWTVRCLGSDYLVDGSGVRAADGGPAPFTHRIVIAWYLLHAGRGEPAGSFAPYRELPGGADFARYMATQVESRLAERFAGRVPDLTAAARAIDGGPGRSEVSADAVLAFPALSKVPLLITFYDADEDFPAEAKLFYDTTAPDFLDLECLAVLGMMLVDELSAHDPAAT